MPVYRFYCLDDAFRIVERLDIAIDSDAAAIQHARDNLGDSHFEIWDAARKVARVSPEGVIEMFNAA